MKKNRKEAMPASEHEHEHEHGRGTIKDNALKAVVTSQLFTTRVMKPKKGKGSFARKDKYKGFKEPYSKAA
ncbi:alternative ribosome rescue factor ArfA [Aliivibrio sp. S4TY2]|uniref:alternative ribosome rescue factor ArfA n=1 Tax=unclassified Aliivibrio TaxID=2645654 RepID=UPI0023796BA6|nr:MULTISPECIES: alternative ribosome rescue factor ArfA [unclassified Aliivibrio]MDD9156668.1 alternative ribosome rescue factor ArfA [Aliivibrio sp. S4TY2]MDD9160154.1 alternative ribosome rescue factor ArfA [Aliivibrio sp. S4TY1]MDD9164554.1 alternative ribosome rescue factor ArfA [Aliivibrio sp. S4MY2]MDD9168577.1 alternative ribosome rescue factor ArfA [Aliivibrio sp. S4MY4]MDD9184888.1 alternative ribosome rescue factor ArfA [Aliivibrio sp. S4MY3]